MMRRFAELLDTGADVTEADRAAIVGRMKEYFKRVQGFEVETLEEKSADKESE